MPYGVNHNLILLTVLNNVFTPAECQIAMPMYMPPPVYAVPAPVPVAVAIQLPPQTKRTTTTTTTTPEPQYAIAVPVPVPMPMPVQVAVPAQPPPVFCQAQPRPKACPPCPPCVCLPSCTPAFFSYCSPCHQKCRCRNPADAPVPLPPNPVPVPVPGPAYPVPIIPQPVAPPPVVLVPLPTIVRRRDTTSSDSDSSDSCDNESDRYYLRGRKRSRKIFKIRKRKYRRDAGDESDGNTDLVKPVLSYMSAKGDVKFETKLSNKDAMKLLSEGKIISSGEKLPNDENDDSTIVTRGGRKSGRRYNKVLLRESPTNHELKKGENNFVFKPPQNKNINSVAVSFQVA